MNWYLECGDAHVWAWYNWLAEREAMRRYLSPLCA